MIVAQIIEEKQKSIDKAKAIFPQKELAQECSQQIALRRSFKHAITKKNGINIIGEIKKASPSRGIIRKDFNVEEIAQAYQLNGISAISVLTEEKFFLGSLDYINTVKQVCTLPVLRKDFIVDEYQLYESCCYGADAVLLIADILSAEQIVEFKDIAASLKMDSLVEAHSEEDLDKAIKSGADIIGINNRDLHTFKLNLKTAENLMHLIPKVKTIVIESGIKSNADLLFLKSLGASAALLGEVFMEAEDISAKVKEVLGK